MKRKKIQIPTVNRIDLYSTYLKETGRKTVKQGEFLWWVFHGKKTLREVTNER